MPHVTVCMVASEWVSGGLTPCRQLRPSSRREHVSVMGKMNMLVWWENSHVMGEKRRDDDDDDDDVATM